MKLLLTLFLCLFCVASAHAEELSIPGGMATGSGISTGIIDKAPDGVSVRDAPLGRVIKVLPGKTKTDAEKDMRTVRAMKQDGAWFQVRFEDESTGWLPSAQLGTCASATEDGDPSMYAEPDDSSATVAKVQQGTPLRLVQLRGTWARVESAAPGAKQSGWMMEQTLFFNAHNNCWAR